MSWLNKLLQRKIVPTKPLPPASSILTRPVQKGGVAPRRPTPRGGLR